MSGFEGSEVWSDLEIKVEILKRPAVEEAPLNLDSDVESMKRKCPEEIKCGVRELLKIVKKSKTLDETESKLQEELKESLLTENEVDDQAKTCERNGHDYLRNSETGPTWDNFLGRLTLDVSVKKRKYEKLLVKKAALETAMIKAKDINEEREINIAGGNKEVEAKYELMKTWQEGIRRLQQAIDEEGKQMIAIKEHLRQETKKVRKGSNDIINYSLKLSVLDDDLVTVFGGEDSNSDLAVTNDKLKSDNAELKQVLSECIAAKESQLQCPYCLEMASPPIYKCSSEHLICNQCFTNATISRCVICSIKLSYKGLIYRYRSAEAAWEEWRDLKRKLFDL